MRINYQETVIDSLLRGAQKNPDSVIVSVASLKNPEQPLTYKDIYQSAIRVAGRLKECKVSRGGRVMTILPTGSDFVSAFFGIQLAGCVPVAIAPVNIGTQQIDYYLNRVWSIIRHCGCKVVLCESSAARLPAFQKLKEELTNICDFIFVDQIQGQGLSVTQIYRPKNEDLCFIQYTSGSTGNTPKGVTITQESLSANIEAISIASKVNGEDSVLSWLPLYHDMGLVGGLLFPFLNEIPLLLFPPELFVFRPHYWLTAISERRITFSPANNFAFQYCVRKVRESQIDGLDLSSWRVSHNGSEPIHIKTIEDFCKKFEGIGFRRETILPCYGLAEGTLAVTLAAPDEAPRYYYFDKKSIYEYKEAKQTKAPSIENIGLIALGEPIKYVEIQIIDENNEPLGSGKVGEIAIRGKTITDGYYSEKAHDEEHFYDGWFKTGDVGFIYDNQLFITGRKKDLIIIRGKNFSPVDIENTIIENSGGVIERCVAFGYADNENGQESLALVVESKEPKSLKNQETEKMATDIVMRFFGVEARRVYFQKKLPRTLNGKIKRSQCRSEYHGQ